MRNSLLKDQEEERTLLEALIEGEESGLAEDFDPKVLLEELHARHGLKSTKPKPK